MNATMNTEQATVFLRQAAASSDRWEFSRILYAGDEWVVELFHDETSMVVVWSQTLTALVHRATGKMTL